MKLFEHPGTVDALREYVNASRKERWTFNTELALDILESLHASGILHIVLNAHDADRASRERVDRLMREHFAAFRGEEVKR